MKGRDRDRPRSAPPRRGEFDDMEAGNPLFKADSGDRERNRSHHRDRDRAREGDRERPRSSSSSSRPSSSSRSRSEKPHGCGVPPSGSVLDYDFFKQRKRSLYLGVASQHV